MSSKIAKLYTAVKKVLTEASALTSLVTANNIRPAEDPSEPESGPVVYYGLTGTKWDAKRGRGEGVLTLNVSSAGNNVDAGEIMDVIRDVLTAKALSYDGSPVTVHMLKESESYADAGTTVSDRWLAATSFDWKLVEAAA